MKKTVEITRELLFGRRRLPSNLRAGFTLALAFAVWLRPPRCSARSRLRLVTGLLRRFSRLPPPERFFSSFPGATGSA